MQIIESSVYGVRSAIYRLEPRRTGPAFTLFPMIHVGEPAYYDDISRRLADCDLILYEGVRLRPPLGLLMPHEAVAGNPRLGLVSQYTMKTDHIQEKMVHADVSAEEFRERWRSIPIRRQLILYLTAPLMLLYCRYLLTRRILARHMGLMLKKSRDEILYRDDDDPFRAIILGWRDEQLITQIEKYRHSPTHADHNIAVLYGANHMRAVLRHLLNEADYRVADGEWTVVFGT